MLTRATQLMRAHLSAGMAVPCVFASLVRRLDMHGSSQGTLHPWYTQCTLGDNLTVHEVRPTPERMGKPVTPGKNSLRCAAAPAPVLPLGLLAPSAPPPCLRLSCSRREGPLVSAWPLAARCL